MRSDAWMLVASNERSLALFSFSLSPPPFRACSGLQAPSSEVC
jgi:hypothetical protein